MNRSKIILSGFTVMWIVAALTNSFVLREITAGIEWIFSAIIELMIVYGYKASQYEYWTLSTAIIATFSYTALVLTRNYRASVEQENRISRFKENKLSEGSEQTTQFIADIV